MMQTRLFTPLVQVALALALLTSAATAAPSRYQLALTDSALRTALQNRDLALLKVQPPRGGAEAQMQRVLDFLGQSRDRRMHARQAGETIRDERSTVLHAADGSWYLEVVGDGSRFRYRGDVDNADEQAAVRSAERLDMDTLERLGSAYVQQLLGGLIELPQDQRLVFLGTRYLVEDSAQEDDTVTEEVIAHIAVFGREVRGTYVLGPGSKIAVWFSGRGEPIGFDVDWPLYTVLSRTQTTLPIDGVWERFYAYADSPGEHLAEPQRFECGYVDLGVFKRQGSLLQAGCAGFYEGTSKDGEGETTWATIEVIPVGVQVYRDAHWPVTGFVREQLPWDLCQALPESCKAQPTSERKPREELPER
jgi:hypothetical protein